MQGKAIEIAIGDIGHVAINDGQSFLNRIDGMKDLNAIIAAMTGRLYHGTEAADSSRVAALRNRLRASKVENHRKQDSIDALNRICARTEEDLYQSQCRVNQQAAEIESLRRAIQLLTTTSVYITKAAQAATDDETMLHEIETDDAASPLSPVVPAFGWVGSGVREITEDERAALGLPPSGATIPDPKVEAAAKQAAAILGDADAVHMHDALSVEVDCTITDGDGNNKVVGSYVLTEVPGRVSRLLRRVSTDTSTDPRPGADPAAPDLEQKWTSIARWESLHQSLKSRGFNVPVCVISTWRADWCESMATHAADKSKPFDPLALRAFKIAVDAAAPVADQSVTTADGVTVPAIWPRPDAWYSTDRRRLVDTLAKQGIHVSMSDMSLWIVDELDAAHKYVTNPGWTMPKFLTKYAP